MPKGYYKNGMPIQKGKKHSKETRQKMSLVKKGHKGYWLGKKRPPLSEEWKEKLRKNNAKFWKGKNFTKEHCFNISKGHLGQKVWNKGKKMPEISGENHYFWQGGITPINKKLRHSIEFRLWREAVFARDNWTCQKCGQRGGKLHSHHIKPFSKFPELRFDIENGITLCSNCHKKIHKKMKDDVAEIKEKLTKDKG